jgi:hypothetical protein
VERLEEKIRFPCVFFLSGRGAVRKREEETGGKGGEEEETERRTRRPARGLRLRLPVDPLLRSSVDNVCITPGLGHMIHAITSGVGLCFYNF